jgi:holo-[acyl-carrier protein] synthase
MTTDFDIRWAVKEAVYKALYPTIVPTWKEVTYESTDYALRQKPSVKYEPFDHRQRSPVGRMHVSVSHDGEYITAQVLVEQNKSLEL